MGSGRLAQKRQTAFFGPVREKINDGRKKDWGNGPCGCEVFFKKPARPENDPRSASLRGGQSLGRKGKKKSERAKATRGQQACASQFW